MQTKIFLQNDIVLDKTISNEAIAVYVALRTIQRQGKDVYFINHLLLDCEICGHFNLSRRYSERIGNGFDELVQKHIVKIVSTRKNSHLVDLGNMVVQADGAGNMPLYTVIYEEEVHTIMNDVNARVDKFALLRYFIILINSISVKTQYNYAGLIVKNFVGFTGMDKLASLLPNANNSKTIISYNNALEEAKLIFIYHSDCIRDKISGRYHTKVNNYGRYDDREYIKLYSESRERYLKYTTEDEQRANKSLSTNNGRRLTMLYRELLKGNNEKYSDDTIQDIYNHIFAHNEKVKKKMNCYKDDISKVQQIYADEWKDEAIFEQFPFLIFKEHLK